MPDLGVSRFCQVLDLGPSYVTQDTGIWTWVNLYLPRSSVRGPGSISRTQYVGSQDQYILPGPQYSDLGHSVGPIYLDLGPTYPDLGQAVGPKLLDRGPTYSDLGQSAGPIYLDLGSTYVDLGQSVGPIYLDLGPVLNLDLGL